MSAPDALVYVDLAGSPYLVGHIWIHAKGSGQSASFEYDASWIEADHHFALEPALKVGPGPYHTTAGRSLFNAIGDSAPDRWGRTLLARRERLEAKKQGRTARTLLDDDYDVGRWEGVAMKLAEMAGLNVASWMVEQVGGRTVLLMHRFDRENGIRIPFLSAMSMLEAVDGKHRSYMEIADALRMHSASASQDLRELWRRVVFTVLISNTDDHLRNHEFIYVGDQGWRLSPAYDLNPVPADVSPRVLSTAIVEGDDLSASMELAFLVAEHFGLERDEAQEIAVEVAGAVAQWRSVAETLGASGAECDRMASAFEHEDLMSLV